MGGGSDKQVQHSIFRAKYSVWYCNAALHYTFVKTPKTTTQRVNPIVIMDFS